VIWTKKNLPTGFDVIIDVVGGDYVQKNINVCAMDGQIVLLSILQGRFCPEVDLAKMLLKRATLTASTLRNRSDDYKTELVNCFEKAFGELLQAGKLLPVIDRCYEWQNADSAHQRMLENSNIGKLVLTI
jgi:NADPH:quinone reductase-like Zn-dependent oxidoreductase